MNEIVKQVGNRIIIDNTTNEPLELVVKGDINLTFLGEVNIVTTGNVNLETLPEVKGASFNVNCRKASQIRNLPYAVKYRSLVKFVMSFIKKLSKNEPKYDRNVLLNKGFTEKQINAYERYMNGVVPKREIKRQFYNSLQLPEESTSTSELCREN